MSKSALCIIPGTIIEHSSLTTNQLIDLNTLISGNKQFELYEVINNLTSIQNLEKQGYNVSVYSFSERKSIKGLLQSGKAISQLTKDQTYQFIYAFWGGISAYIITLFSKKPVFITLMGSDLLGTYTPNGKPSKKGIILKTFSKLACKRAAGVIVMSNHMKQQLNPAIQHKTLIAPECIDLNKFYPIHQQSAREHLHLPKDKKIIIFFNGQGRIVKNGRFAQKVIDKVALSYPNTLFIKIEGVPHHELIYYYNAADVLLITSLHEGSNNSIKEAIACNCPVVSSKAGDAYERLSQLELCKVIPQFDVESYEKAILKIFNANTRPNIRHGVDDLTFEKTGQKIKAFIEERLKEVSGE